MKKLLVRNMAPGRGVHLMRLDEVEPVQGRWGASALRFHFTVVDGPEEGKEIQRTTSSDAKLGGSLVKLVTELAGREPAPGDYIDPEAFIGGTFIVDVASGEADDRGGAYVRIKSIRPSVNNTISE